MSGFIFGIEKGERHLRKKNRFRPLIFALLISTLAAPRAEAWYEKIHSYLIKMASEMIAREDGEKELYRELYLKDPLLHMGRGAWREDYAPPVAGNSRAFRHYYDPDAPRMVKGVAYYSHYLLWPHLEAGSEVSEPSGGFYDGAMRWALDGADTLNNPFHWQGAIQAFSSGTIAGKQEAYLRLGHVLHLLGDMSEPDHATNTPHPGSGKHLPGELEEFVADKIADVVLFIRREARRLGANDIADLAAAFVEAELRDRIRKYVKTDFERRYGAGRVQLIGLEGLIEDSLEPRNVQEYFTERERSRIPARVPGLPVISLKGTKVWRRSSTFNDFFDTLARKAKDEQERSSLPLPVGCAHLAPLLFRFVQENARQQATAWAGFGDFIKWPHPEFEDWAQRELWSAFMPEVLKEPLYFIPTINEFKEQDFRPYFALGEILLQETVGYVAGLMMLFHDIVNEPPFVQEVKVIQSGERYYRGTWREDLSASRSTGRTEEEYRGVRTTDVPKFYKILARDMEWEPKNSFLFIPKELLSGRSTKIEISFGPITKWSDVVIQERIDPESVKVMVDGKSIGGEMTGPNTWRGIFVPRLRRGEGARYFKIEVEARDLHAHHPRPNLPFEKYALDSKPGSVAEPRIAGPGYLWNGYDPGPDKNHEFFVKPAPETEPVQDENTPDLSWVGTWSVRSEHTQGNARGRSFSWSFTVEQTGGGFVVITRDGRFPARVSGTNLVWTGTGGGNIVDVNLALAADGSSFKGTFSGGHYAKDGKKTDAIAGTYSGSRIRQ